MAAPHSRSGLACVTLIALTLTGLGLSRTGLPAWLAGCLLLGLATIKGRLVVLDFFGLRGAPGPWRAILSIWIAAVAATALAASAASLLL